MVHSDLNSPIVGAGISLFGKLAQHLGLHLFNSCSPCATQHCRILHKKNTPAAASCIDTVVNTEPATAYPIHTQREGG